MQTVNESSTITVPVAFYDKNGDPETPASITYRIDDVSSGAEIVSDTSMTPATSVDITVSANDNAILNANRRMEARRMTITAAYGASEQATEVVYWQVKNLVRV